AAVGGVVGEGVHHVRGDERPVHVVEGGALRPRLRGHHLWREYLHPLYLLPTVRAPRRRDCQRGSGIPAAPRLAGPPPRFGKASGSRMVAGLSAEALALSWGKVIDLW